METRLTFPNVTDNEIVIRTGAALPEIEPRQVYFNGDITSVKTFLDKRFKAPGDFIGPAEQMQLINPETAIITVNKDAQYIKLFAEPSHPFGTVIIGALHNNPELEQFRINTTATFNREAFLKLLRFNKIWFDNPGIHEKLLTQLATFYAATNTNTQQASDNRGNKTNNFQKAVTADVLTSFVLKMPLFKNDAPARFNVEIYFDVTEASIKFWLESVELHEALNKRRDEIFSEQLAGLSNDFVIIYE